ncbi:endonuclease domain-containing 1 protein-like [Colossoma macropomum]|uniref:endonuclease domain-containing 1 protein-like n=1 Tax=Colossoma macropomum TaxID=42526 RepID=UPI00186513CE|nr:endonuclease domain-containing 1 protein-like [Colossoma macropomum]
MNLLTPVLLLLALSGCSSEVVPDFTQQCRAFFVNPAGTVSPPTVFPGNNYKQICQIRVNTYEYATLYDTANRIPVYSAYKFDGIKHCVRNGSWYIEPQLEGQHYGPKMASESSVTQINNQAVNEDYTGTSTHHFVKGHLAPVLHATSQSCSDATFTLTNAAPQNDKFNNGEWKRTENAVAKALGEKCTCTDITVTPLSSLAETTANAAAPDYSSQNPSFHHMTRDSNRSTYQRFLDF